jgi:hypothetical protein
MLPQGPDRDASDGTEERVRHLDHSQSGCPAWASRSPSCLTVCSSSPARRAVRTQWRDLDRATAAGSKSRSSSSPASTSTLWTAGPAGRPGRRRGLGGGSVPLPRYCLVPSSQVRSGAQSSWYVAVVLPGARWNDQRNDRRAAFRCQPTPQRRLTETAPRTAAPSAPPDPGNRELSSAKPSAMPSKALISTNAEMHQFVLIVTY